MERLQKTCNELSKIIYQDKFQINKLLYKTGDYLTYQDANKDLSNFSQYSDGVLIDNSNRYWFQKKIELTKDFLGNTIVFEIETGKENGWDAINPQFLVYINGESQQGFDTNHRKLFIEVDKVGLEFEISIHAYTGTQNDDVGIKCYISKVELNIQKIFFDLSVLQETLIVLNSDSSEYNMILNTCNKAIDTLDFRDLNNVIETSIVASEIIESEIFSKSFGKSSIVSLVGHTHIDVAWLWTLKQTREKAVRSFSTVVKLMEQYDHYKFMSSQPQLYQFVKEDNPILYSKIQKLVQEGRWEVEGGMWLESDCNIPSGESLIRQLQKGKQFFKQEFNVDSKILWLPDVFGYSAALPQILKSIGIDYFLTTKISWNEYNKMPYDTFYWKGLGGTEILTYFVTTNDYEKVVKNDHRTIYEGTINPSQVKGTYARYQQKLINNNTMMIYGHGDGGGGPTFEMLEYSKRLFRGIPGLPMVRESNSLDYFKELECKLSKEVKTPKWSGELYLEYHRGTYTTSSRSKKYNRKSEQLVHDLEFLSVLYSMINKHTVNYSLIEKSWDIILLNQFHDIIPGTSISEVYDESFKQYEEVMDEMSSEIRTMLSVGMDTAIIVNELNIINTTSFSRDDFITFKYNPLYKSIEYKDSYYPIQETYNGKGIAYIKSIVPLGITKCHFSELEISTKSYAQTIHKIENYFFNISFNSLGYIDSLYDKEMQREIIEQDGIANQFVAYEDMPHNWDAWDINRYYDQKSYPVDTLVSSSIIEDGPVRTIVRQKRQYNNSVINQDVIVYSQSRRIDFVTSIDWNEKHTLLRVLFPITISNQYATYEIQYGNVQRTTHENTTWDQAMFEVPAQKWVDLSEGNYGVSLLNDCKYGHSIKGSTIGLSLLKSSQWPCQNIDEGTHQFTYSLYPHLFNYRKGGTIKEAYKLNYPLYITSIDQNINKSLHSLLNVSDENIVIEVVKQNKEEDYVTIRMYESQNNFTKTVITSCFDMLSAKEVNLEGKVLNELNPKGNSLNITFTPFDIKTIRINFKF
jgi:alpha-mannosidase